MYCVSSYHILVTLLKVVTQSLSDQFSWSDYIARTSFYIPGFYTRTYLWFNKLQIWAEILSGGCKRNELYEQPG